MCHEPPVGQTTELETGEFTGVSRDIHNTLVNTMKGKFPGFLPLCLCICAGGYGAIYTSKDFQAMFGVNSGYCIYT